jgi:type II secretory pathway pseudopilin PulG
MRVKMMRMQKAVHGVTLVEALIAVGIIALLAALILPGLKHHDNQSKRRAVQTLMAVLDTALTEYHEQTGYFPESDALEAVIPPVVTDEEDRPAYQIQYLVQLLRNEPSCTPIIERISSKFLVNKAFKKDATLDQGPELYDPWEGLIRYYYDPSMNFPLILSAGPDGTFGTADDITNRK